MLIFKLSLVASAAENVKYDPPRPEDALEEIRDAVMLGYNILNKTQKYASEYVGNELNCHFEGGLTQCGKNGGEYPTWVLLNILNIEKDMTCQLV